MNTPPMDTPINLPKIAKKSFVAWLVPTLCIAVIMGLVTIARSWADDRYTQKADFSEEQKKRESLETGQQEINRKLDLLIYIAQHDGRLTPNEMKGKLTQP